MKKSGLSAIKEYLKVISEFYHMIRSHKKWWLVPILLVFALSALLLTLAGAEVVLPLMYMLF